MVLIYTSNYASDAHVYDEGSIWTKKARKMLFLFTAVKIYSKLSGIVHDYCTHAIMIKIIVEWNN